MVLTCGKDAKTQASGSPRGQAEAAPSPIPLPRPPYLNQPWPDRAGEAAYLAFCVRFPAKAGKLALALGKGASEEVLASLSLLSSR